MKNIIRKNVLVHRLDYVLIHNIIEILSCLTNIISLGYFTLYNLSSKYTQYYFKKHPKIMEKYLNIVKERNYGKK